MLFLVVYVSSLAPSSIPIMHLSLHEQPGSVAADSNQPDTVFESILLLFNNHEPTASSISVSTSLLLHLSFTPSLSALKGGCTPREDGGQYDVTGSW